MPHKGLCGRRAGSEKHAVLSGDDIKQHDQIVRGFAKVVVEYAPLGCKVQYNKTLLVSG